MEKHIYFIWLGRTMKFIRDEFQRIRADYWKKHFPSKLECQITLNKWIISGGLNETKCKSRNEKFAILDRC